MSHHPDRGRSMSIHGAFRQPNPSVVHTQHTYANNEYNPVLAGNTSMPSTLAMSMGMSNPMQMLPAVYQGQPYWPGIPSSVARSGHYGFAAPTQVSTNSQLQNGPTANIPMQTMGYGLGTPGPGVYINPRFSMMNMTQGNYSSYGNNVPLQESGSNSQSPQEPPNAAHNS
ncbi:hypothetical protein CPB86DRAFT_814670 [Serendipita vermifera]|nr:hypothetical protein CPB86DRAFT_814670 [Serendipita vermifera]